MKKRMIQFVSIFLAIVIIILIEIFEDRMAFFDKYPDWMLHSHPLVIIIAVSAFFGLYYLIKKLFRPNEGYPDDEIVYECEKCGKKFGQRNNAEEHEKQCEFKKELLHECEYCGKQFRLLTKANEHEKTCSLKSKSYGCRFCGQGFNNKKDAMQHEKHCSNDG